MSILDHSWGESLGADFVWSRVCALPPSVSANRKLMVLQAYIDDSRSDKSGFFVLGGYIASAEQWAKFSSEWEKILPLACIDKRGKHRFKMSEMAAQSRDVRPFYKVISENVQASIACIIDMTVLKRVIDGLEIAIKFADGVQAPLAATKEKARWGDPNYLAFIALMSTFHTEIVRSEEGMPGVKVDFYFDEWGKKRLIQQMWDGFIKRQPAEHQLMYGREPRFESDDEFLPLQAADFHAWWVRHWAESHGMDKGKWVFPFPRHERKILHLTLWAEEDKLAETLRNNIQSSAQEHIDNGGEIEIQWFDPTGRRAYMKRMSAPPLQKKGEE